MPTSSHFDLDAGWYGPVMPSAEEDRDPHKHELVLLVRSPVYNLEQLVEDLQRQLENDGSAWKLHSEVGTHPVVTPLTLSYPGTGVDRPKPGPNWLLNMLTRHGLSVWADPLLVGSPVYKPHALTRGDMGRVPVSVLTQEPPPRRPCSALPHGRRPVVALLDTVVQPHPWLGEADDDLTGEGFWVDAHGKGWNPGPRLLVPDGQTVTGGVLGSQEGHGTFCAGLVRQIAPDAQVLAVQVISDDGRVYGDHVLNALGWLLEEELLVEGDVVCLPFGFRPIWPTDSTYLGWLGAILGEFGKYGISVVAAAGNDGEQYPVYPAAFAVANNPPNPPKPALVSVGALNTNGKTRAEYSNYGPWVTDWAVGTSVVSTFPRVNGAARPEFIFEGEINRESADPDDFTGGFARWSGTSFAATIHAATLAGKRTAGPGAGSP
jgi:hypothetical protein